MIKLHPPKFRLEALAVWRRNALVWKRLMAASLLLHFGEPLLYLIGIGYGLQLGVFRLCEQTFSES